jgi:hypothetical protein
MSTAYDYGDLLTASQRINWRIEDILGGGRELDFEKPFLPESLARVGRLSFLDEHERLALNHIRANGYLYLFGLVEEFIVPFVLDHTGSDLSDDARTRAMLQFASEEAKHIDLFRRFAREFEAGFAVHCGVIGPPSAIAAAVLEHDPLAVGLLILQIEWMTQRHYVDSVKDDQDLDPQFKSLLRHHWMEEAQHAKLDTLMVERLAAGRSVDEIDAAIDGYFSLGALVDGGLRQQVELDLASFEAATGRKLDEAEARAFLSAQHQAQRWTFIGSGITHPNFLASVGLLTPSGRARLEDAAPAFS